MPHPHTPTPDPPEQSTLDTVPASSASGHRARIPGVDPDEVLRNIRSCNGFRSWSFAPREVYQLADSTLTVDEHHQHTPELVVDGPEPEQIRSLLARLGFDQETVTIHALQPAEETP